MFTNLIEKLGLQIEKALPFIDSHLVNTGLNATNGSMVNHFENARNAFNHNGEVFLMYGLIFIVSLIIGIGVYTLTNSKQKKKKQS